jgi:cephalosporin-C deacetylase-like acetyl esterase
MAPLALLLICLAGAAAQPLPGTKPLEFQGDPVAAMNAGFERYLEKLTAETPPARRPSAEKLARILGVVDKRAPFESPLLAGTLRNPALLAETPAFRVIRVRWPALEGIHGEGLLYEQKGGARCRIIAVPDAGAQPESLAAAQSFAAAGCDVLAPVLLSRGTSLSGVPGIRTGHMPHREWIYRMAFPVGRHIIGFEVQKVLAAVDYLKTAAVWGEGDGALIGLYAAALDRRITAAALKNTPPVDATLHKQPIDRNVHGLLRDFGDRELDALTNGVIREPESPRDLLVKLGLPPAASSEPIPLSAPHAEERERRQIREMADFTERLVEASEGVRDRRWKDVKGGDAAAWRENAEPLAQQFIAEVIGRLPGAAPALNVRTRQSYDDAKWTGYEAMFDVREGVIGYGVLLVPKALKPGEKRPLVVVQHGLQGRPQHLFQVKQGRELDVYRNFGAQLADLGFVVYLPQNPYTGEFRHLTRLSHPLGMSIYALIRAQYDRMLDWLETLPFVDRERIGYYGLSYGGKVALRVPPFDRRYQAAVCAGDFNEWIRKMSLAHVPFSYVYTVEYDMLEWDLASWMNHSEMARLMAPRAFMVERGHRDGVGIDEWISYEYAKVRRFYDEMGIGERTEIAFFNGPHRVDGPAVIAFLRKWLGW